MQFWLTDTPHYDAEERGIFVVWATWQSQKPNATRTNEGVGHAGREIVMSSCFSETEKRVPNFIMRIWVGSDTGYNLPTHKALPFNDYHIVTPGYSFMLKLFISGV